MKTIQIIKIILKISSFGIAIFCGLAILVGLGVILFESNINVQGLQHVFRWCIPVGIISFLNFLAIEIE